MSKLSRKYVILAAVTIGILLVAGLVYATVFAPTVPVTTPVTGTEQASSEGATEEATLENFDPATAEEWIKAGLVDRTLGSDDAPITMYDFSSLTCPHCADFHAKTLPQLKKDYIDTGKVKLVFADFPLNLPALQAATLARCVTDKDAYFAFIDELFRTQAKWGMSNDARNDLLNATKFSGLSREDAARCLDSKHLTAGMLQKIDENRTKYNLNSTPTFIFVKDERQEKVEGAQPIEQFKAAIDKLQ